MIRDTIMLGLMIGISAPSTAAAEKLRYDGTMSFDWMKAIVAADIAAYKAEPPGECVGEHLATVYANAKDIEDHFTSLVALQMSAGWILDAADVAAERDCPDMARMLYQRVIRVYIGSGFAAHRQRAEIGLADLRARR